MLIAGAKAVSEFVEGEVVDFFARSNEPCLLPVSSLSEIWDAATELPRKAPETGSYRECEDSKNRRRSAEGSSGTRNSSLVGDWDRIELSKSASLSALFEVRVGGRLLSTADRKIAAELGIEPSESLLLLRISEVPRYRSGDPPSEAVVTDFSPRYTFCGDSPLVGLAERWSGLDPALPSVITADFWGD
jgi:hypothetical protein